MLDNFHTKIYELFFLKKLLYKLKFITLKINFLIIQFIN